MPDTGPGKRGRKRSDHVRVIHRKNRPCWLLRWRNKDGDWVERQTEIPAPKNRDEAIKAAAKLEVELAAAEGVQIIDRDWEDAVKRFEAARVNGLAEKTQQQWHTARRAIVRLLPVARCSDMTTDWVDDFAQALREDKKEPASVAAYLRWVKIFTRYATRKKWISRDAAPDIEMPAGSSRKKRSRELNWEQFELVLEAAKVVRPDSHTYWHDFLLGLWHTGMRVSELHALSWDGADADVLIDFTRPRPGFHFVKQKNRKEQWVPMTPDFYRLFVAPVDKRLRHGFVFWLPGEQRGRGGRVNAHSAMEITNAIGKKSGLRTGGKKDAPKFATSADFGRRAFATRMRPILGQWELAGLLRHEDPSTTNTFYAGDGGDALAEKLWQISGEPPKSPSPEST